MASLSYKKSKSFSIPKVEKSGAKSLIWIGIVILVWFFMGKIAKLIAGFFPVDTKGQQEQNQNQQLSAVKTQLNKEVTKSPLTLPDYKYDELANNIYKIIDNRNYITGGYDNAQLRAQFYLLQKNVDWLKLQSAWGANRAFTYGLIPRTALLSLTDLGLLLDSEDKKLLNQRFQQKKILFSFT